MSDRRVHRMQPVPNVSATDVERIVRRDYRPQEVASVLDDLTEYGKEAWHREPLRVRLAILRLAAGDREALRSHLEVAKRDYRDVLAGAEYPNYLRRVPASEDLADQEKQKAINQDWRQYQNWFEKK